MAGGLGKLVKQMKGLKGTTWQLQNSHGDVKHNTEDIINNTVITVLVSDGYQLNLLGSLCKSYICLTIMLYPRN